MTHTSCGIPNGCSSSSSGSMVGLLWQLVGGHVQVHNRLAELQVVTLTHTTVMSKGCNTSVTCDDVTSCHTASR